MQASRLVSHDLTDPEIRVLGCLLEKQRMTPDAYPLTLNALRAACNQSTNRDPVVDYDESVLRDALARLGHRRWTRLASYHGSRASKYRHLIDEALGIRPDEQAVLAVLLLRGPQTPGELRQRTERLHHFASGEELDAAIEGLANRDLVVRLERRPGQKESRYAHLLGTEPVDDGRGVAARPCGATRTALPRIEEQPPPPDVPARDERLERLESEVAELRAELGRCARSWDLNRIECLPASIYLDSPRSRHRHRHRLPPPPRHRAPLDAAARLVAEHRPDADRGVGVVHRRPRRRRSGCRSSRGRRTSTRRCSRASSPGWPSRACWSGRSTPTTAGRSSSGATAAGDRAARGRRCAPGRTCSPTSWSASRPQEAAALEAALPVLEQLAGRLEGAARAIARASSARTPRSRIPNYRRYLAGQSVSLTGTWMQMTALAWLVSSR